ncbi:efflux RND transporter periplasmic adaptor subunit [Synechococcus sp. CS-1325]|uniref:HlyD family secretion protein n=1 Tax=unclassified Synechococcus TaxID=2626047 RepID=UPI000DB2FA63|nr:MULTISPECIES: efflux RND transporter periplasmic adaptor subunit [unclassified Synechococcus]PZV00690.1 MAG: glycoside hydrolase family 43 [Cyanobium sp.]MCT0200908.1 efflux RND transporter periplasmic adaptor subunit [Synechococcus sp. CS-1325]MCT0213946.1 efflux RND transporter periplasmic adaptor subunit [Synechococcus sp. CS-1326]MCT0230848.1 efflux RND transporter periplasmic adaptor subunit [Synechococcus sp. CS-1324]MCT0233522.1 efflux RND transporter periplasmic adaptor subunit [Syn
MIRGRWLLVLGGLLVAGGGAGFAVWQASRPTQLPDSFARGNGRIEAVEIDVATKAAGRIDQVLKDEGDFVVRGQVLARMDTDVLTAQLRGAQADLRKATRAVETAESTVLQRRSERTAAEAVVVQRSAEREDTRRHRRRQEQLFVSGAVSAQDLDDARASFYGADAVVAAAQATVAASRAAISTAGSLVIEAESSVTAAQARIEAIRADITDSQLKAPRDGRVQYRVAQPGEVLSAGGKVLNMVDLSDVSMTFFLPTDQAGRVRLGSEVHLVLDAAPQLVIPAQVSFVADVAQFTPKTVETAIERQKLMFRIKARIDSALLKRHIRSVKTGLPGMAYVRLDPRVPWPANLTVKVPG